MSFRNSGGYLPSPDRHSSYALSEDIPQPNAQAVDLQAQVAESEVIADDVEDEIPANHPGLLAMENQDDLNLDFMPWVANEQGHHIFFDAFDDAQGLTEDLDWLFGNLPADPYYSGGPSIEEINNTSSISPNSTMSAQASTDTPSNAVDPWFAIRANILSHLLGMQADLIEDPFFEPPNLKRFFDIYFTSYNPHFPILHQASFKVEDAPPLLLLAVVTLGATLDTEPSHFSVAEKIHDNLRWLIFSCPDFQPPAPLWCLQALLLVQAYEKMFSSRKRHEMAHIFHGAVITLMRRGSSYSSDRPDNPGPASSLERSWHSWVEQESSKRVAYFAFIMDAQHASIFGHTPALSVSDVRLSLPCAEEVWESSTAARWKRTMAKSEEPAEFLPMLRTLLSRQPIPPSSSPFARFILLHGLFSVTKHMQARDLTASDVGTNRSHEEGSGSPLSTLADDNWKEILDRAIDTWSFLLLSQEPSLCLEAARPLHRIAHLTIHVNLIDFHIFAGAPALTSNHITREEYGRAKKRIKAWCSKPAAKRTLLHCVLLIQETMFTRSRYRAKDDNIALRPWCLYHATLVLWTYGIVTEGKYTGRVPGAEEYLVHLLTGLMGDLVQLKGTNKNAGLLSAVRDSLSDCRWELLQEAYSTLNRLIELSSVGNG